jgi:hypothetical protein
MSGGMVTGGWNFVIAAYVVTFSVLFIYGVSIVTRLREERSRSTEEANRQ